MEKVQEKDWREGKIRIMKYEFQDCSGANKLEYKLIKFKKEGEYFTEFKNLDGEIENALNRQVKTRQLGFSEDFYLKLGLTACNNNLLNLELNLNYSFCNFFENDEYFFITVLNDKFGNLINKKFILKKELSITGKPMIFDFLSKINNVFNDIINDNSKFKNNLISFIEKRDKKINEINDLELQFIISDKQHFGKSIPIDLFTKRLQTINSEKSLELLDFLSTFNLGVYHYNYSYDAIKENFLESKNKSGLEILKDLNENKLLKMYETFDDLFEILGDNYNKTEILKSLNFENEYNLINYPRKTNKNKNN